MTKRTSRRKAVRTVRRNSRAKAPISRVSWNVFGVAEGDARTIREAERQIAAERSHVGHLKASLFIHRTDGSRERRAA
jgi:hypothetical protein